MLAMPQHTQLLQRSDAASTAHEHGTTGELVSGAYHVTAEQALEHLRQGSSIRKAAQTFYSLDKDGDGSLTANELRKALATNRLLLSDRELSRLMAQVDDDNDGNVHIQEFLKKCHSHIGYGVPRAIALSEPPAVAAHTGNHHERLSESGVRTHLTEIANEFPMLLDILPGDKVKTSAAFDALDTNQDSFIDTDTLRSHLRKQALRTLPPTRMPEGVLSETIKARARDKFGYTAEPLGVGDISGTKAALSTALPFDEAIDTIVNLCDTNVDGHVTSSDLAAVSDALHGRAESSLHQSLSRGPSTATSSRADAPYVPDVDTTADWYRSRVSTGVSTKAKHTDMATLRYSKLCSTHVVSVCRALTFISRVDSVTPFWREDNSRVIVPDSSTPSFAANTDRLQSTAQLASSTGYVLVAPSCLFGCSNCNFR
jgi:Ca2+-binding EF-hand superfamily protein